MDSPTTLLLQLGLNGGLAALLVMTVALTPHRILWRGEQTTQLVLGLGFGLVALLAMQATLTPAPGVTIDMRTVVCAISAFSIGPLSGLVTLAITALYRISLGGAGLLPGLGALTTVTLLGWLWRRAHLGARCSFGLALVGLALSVPLAALLWTLALAGEVRATLLPRLLLPVPLAFGAGVLLLGSLIEMLRQRANTLSELERAVHQLQLSRDELNLAIAAAGAGRWDWDLREPAPHYYGPLYEKFGLGDLSRGVDMERWQGLFHPDDLLPARTALEDYLHNRSDSYSLQFRLRDQQGQWRWIVSRGQATERNRNGTVRRMIGMHYDETARLQAEQAVALERSKFAGIFQTLPDAAGSTRISDGHYIEVNAAFSRVTGYSRDDVVGRTSIELGIWDSPQERDRLLAALARDGFVDRLVMVARHKSGRRISGQMSARPTLIGGDDCMVFVFRDLSHEQLVERELLASRAALDSAGRLGRLGAWINYYDGSMPNYLSPVFRDIVGIGPDDPVPQNFAQRFVLEPHRKHFLDLERRGRDERMGWDIELEIIRPDAQQLWVRIVGEPVLVDGTLQCVQGLIQDIDASRRNLDRLRQSEEKFSRIFMFLPEAMAIIAQDSGCYQDVNPAWEALTGYARGAVLGRTALQIGLLNPAQREQIREAWARDQRADDLEIDIRTSSGETRVTLVSMRLMDIDGTPCWVSMHRDITERRRVQAQIQEREEQLSLSVAAANLGMWDFDLVQGRMSGNARWRELRGLRADELSVDVERARASCHPADLPALLAALTLHLKDSERVFEAVSRSIWPDGSQHWIRDRGKVVARDPAGRAVRMLGLTMDVTEQREQQDRLQQLAHFDPLTGLANRVLLADRMRQAMAHAERTGEMLGVVYLDLDGFKPVNDRLGHAAGDQLLIEIARRLAQAMRAADSVARLGGDEFVLLLAALANTQDCELALARAMAAICAPYEVAGELVSVTASMGATLYPADRSDVDTLLRHADQAMYVAKQGGRNRFHFFDSGQEQAARIRGERISELRRALNDGEFVLYLQPRVNMRNGEVVGAEALARWQHPVQGLLAPARFLPDIEGSELNSEFGEWVIDSALTLLQGWQEQGLGLALSINITARHLQSAGFSARLAQRLLAYPGVRSNRLEIEVTESGSLSDLDAAVSVIEQLHQLGVQLSLDDFGTGYSSLTYLRRLPVDTLKIDQSFVRDMLVDPDDRAIVQGVIGLAHSFGRAVVAEGVETAAQGGLLLQMGCEMAQGYGIAKPLPQEQLLPWIVNWTAGWNPESSWRKPSVY